MPDWLRLMMEIFHGQHGWGSVADWSTPNPYNLYQRPTVEVPQQFHGNPLGMPGGTPDGMAGSVAGGGAMPLSRA